jgi:cytochrome P450
VRHYQVLAVWGPNIVASEGETWKRFRKISAPAFSDRNNRLVWDETVKIMNELFDSPVMWGGKERIEVDHALHITLPVRPFEN